MTRFVPLVVFLGGILVAAALLVACGGNTALAPLTEVRSTTAPSALSTSGISIGAAPTPLVPTSPIGVPTPVPVPTSSSLTGLPSPSPAAS